MLARLSAFVIWALVAATAVFWGLRLSVRAPAAPPHTIALGETAAVRGDLTRLLGAAPTAVAAVSGTVQPEAASRFRLIGVMAPRPAAAAAGRLQGVALIAVDGKPPKAYAVGARLDGELMLQSVSLRSASIGAGKGQPTLLLELPPLPPPATGTLPPIGAALLTQPAVVPGGLPVPPAVLPPPGLPGRFMQPPQAGAAAQ
jgi:general secretion pathway protein C